jgi:hypothetical protein
MTKCMINCILGEQDKLIVMFLVLNSQVVSGAARFMGQFTPSFKQ